MKFFNNNNLYEEEAWMDDWPVAPSKKYHENLNHKISRSEYEESIKDQANKIVKTARARKHAEATMAKIMRGESNREMKNGKPAGIGTSSIGDILNIDRDKEKQPNLLEFNQMKKDIDKLQKKVELLDNKLKKQNTIDSNEVIF